MKYLLTISSLAMLAAFGACAQTSSPDTAAIQALLTEVRQLRVAVEKSVLLGPKIQLTLQRMQLHDQRVARISQQLEDVRKQIAAETAQQARLARVEQQISTEADAALRKELEDLRESLQRAAASNPDQQLRARESELTSSLEAEQAALKELDDKLEAIERQLDLPQAADAQHSDAAPRR